MATPPKHWLHKSPAELLDAAGSPSPLEVLRIRLCIKYQQSVFVVLGADDWREYGVPALAINRGHPNSSRPLWELVLGMMMPATAVAATSLLCPQLVEFGFARPLAVSAETRLDIAVIVSPQYVDPQWTPQGSVVKGWWPLTEDAAAELFAGRVLHRILGMNNQRVTTTQADRYSTRLEILRSIGGCIRHAELSGCQDLESVAILEPTDADMPIYPQRGLFLMTVSPQWMNEIRASMHAMDFSNAEDLSPGRSGLRTFRAIGWIDRRQHAEVMLADTALSLEGTIRPDGSVAQNWIPSRIHNLEFFLQTSDRQPAMEKLDSKLVMGI